MRSFRVQCILSIAGLFTSVFLTEIILHILSGYSPKIAFMTSNPYQQSFLNSSWKIGTTLIQCPQPPGGILNEFQLNQKGFLTPETPYKKPTNTKRIVFIGDSQTVGIVPYRLHFTRLIEQQLMHQYPNIHIEIINLGVNCIGPTDSKKILASEGMQYNPDVVVYTFFAGNDFTDDIRIKNKFDTTQMKQKSSIPMVFFQSKLFSLFRNTIFLWRSPSVTSISDPQSSNKTSNYNPFQPSFSDKDYLRLETDRSHIMVPNSFVYDAPKQVTDTILSMNTLAQAGGAKFLLLILPDEIQVNYDLFTRVMQLNETDITHIVSDYPQRILRQTFFENNFPIIDPLETWRAASASATYYQPNDSHLNSIGNEAIRDVLLPYIEDAL